ncbi:MAG: sporulation protein YqfD [Lachnospiraceae bacterium]|nr:sporulation protein YqfD [Lachnospiraceae bacterium]
MNNSLLRWFLGYIEVHIHGANQERFLNICANHNVKLWNLRSDKEGIAFNIIAADFKRIRSFADKSGIRMRVTEKAGLPFFMHANRKRKLLAVGVLAALVIIYGMSFFIWDISFEGNVHYTDEVLLKHLSRNGYHPLMLKNKITCEDIETGIRHEYDDITWVSARIDGSRLVVAVNENEIASEATAADNRPVDIVSDVNGVITDIVTRSGTPMVAVGDEVSEGQVLVSGVLEITDDGESVVNRHFTCSDADISAQTMINYYDKIPVVGSEKAYTGKNRQKYYLMIGDFKINLPGIKDRFKISDDFDIKKLPSEGIKNIFTDRYEMYDSVDEVHHARLGDSLFLPLRWGRITDREYIFNGQMYTKNEAKGELSSRLEDYIEKLIKKGIQIIDKNVKIDRYDDSYIMSGEITVIESIGRSVPLDTSGYAENEPHEENVQ